MLILSFNFSPSENVVPVIDQLAHLACGIPGDNIVIMGNFKAKSSIWEDRSTDQSSEEVISFALHNYFEIIDSPHSVARFCSHQG